MFGPGKKSSFDNISKLVGVPGVAVNASSPVVGTLGFGSVPFTLPSSSQSSVDTTGPNGSQESFGSDVIVGTAAVLGSSTPVVSSQSVKPSPSLSTALGHPGIVIVIVAVSHTAGVTAVLHTS